ncbi:MAG TPA: dihydrodipicolinate synthase family protein [Vicinamibacteria bacterium]|nr:dihydrodipicolinate synthase family protein [Vicinamibacteria bacterium]
MTLRGVIPPLVTPFREDGSLDEEAFEANLERYAAFDLAGYLVLGSNGEAGSLDEDEKLRLLRAARRRAAGRTVMAGTGLESTRATQELTRRAADAGADAALVLTPHYYRPQMTQDVLTRHFEAVAEASPIPVLLYTVPQFTGVSCPPGLPAALAAHPRVRGIKDSSGDVALLGRIVASVPEAFSVLCGSAPVFYPALCAGAAGGVLAVACCAPRPAAALFRAFERGDHRSARRIQEALTPLAAAVTATHGVPGLKAAMDVAGFRGGWPRPPLLPFDPAGRGELHGLLEQAEAAVDGGTLPG